MALPLFNEVVLDTPVTLTGNTTAQPIFKQPYKWVTSICIRVRSIGTATYVGVGNNISQDYRLIGVDQMYQYSCNPGEVIDAAKIWIISDTADPVVEVIASYLPVARVGSVELAIGQR